jgi:hypothetical protein
MLEKQQKILTRVIQTMADAKAVDHLTFAELKAHLVEKIGGDDLLALGTVSVQELLSEITVNDLRMLLNASDL